MPNLSIDEQVRIISSLGFHGMEMVCIERSTTDVDSLDAAERKRIRKLLDDAGLELPALHASVNPIDPDPERRAANRARLRRSIDLAADLAGRAGVPAVVVMAYGKPEEYEQIRGDLAQYFSELAEYAETRGATLALELHVGQAFDLPEKGRWLLDAVDHPRFRLNLDTSHFDVMGISIPDSVRPLVQYAVHTHVKDQRGRYPNHEFLVPGDGDYDYVAYLRELDAGGYTGFVTVEISVMVQRKPGYDPSAAAAQTYRVMKDAFDRAGLTPG